MVFAIVAAVLVVGIVLLVVFAMTTNDSGVGDRIAAIDASIGSEGGESSILQRLLDQNQRQKLTGQFLEAGWYDATPQKFAVQCVGQCVAGVILGAFCAFVLHLSMSIALLLPLVAGIYGAYRPYASLESSIKKRKKQVHRSLPDFLDMLSTTIEAGVALNSAIAIALDAVTGALHEELAMAMHDVRLGRSRADALVAMAQRVREVDLTGVVTAIVQSERLGGSIADVLRNLSIESREARIIHAEEVAAQLPNKLIFPMALCMLPALMIIIFGGVLAKFVK